MVKRELNAAFSGAYQGLLQDMAVAGTFELRHRRARHRKAKAMEPKENAVQSIRASN